MIMLSKQQTLGKTAIRGASRALVSSLWREVRERLRRWWLTLKLPCQPRAISVDCCLEPCSGGRV